MGKLGRDTNLRSLSVKPGDGKMVDDTSMLKGEGKFTSAQNDTNDMKQYSTGSMPSPGKLGGEPCNQ